MRKRWTALALATALAGSVAAVAQDAPAPEPGAVEDVTASTP